MTEFMKKARQNVKNHKASYLVSTTVAACTALVLFARSCGPGAAGPEGPALAVRGDGICHEVESYPYQRDRNTGQVLCQRGQEAPAPTGTLDATTHAVSCPQGSSPVANGSYAPEDCFYGNNVCDNQADPAQVKDPAGNAAQWMPQLLTRARVDGGAAEIPSIRYLSGRTVQFPLESETSLDCMLARVRTDPCAEFTQGSTPVQRPRFTFPPGTVDERTRQRTQEEIVSMHAHPETLRTGGNYFTIYVGYEESCDRNLPICTPESTAPCWCPNIVECAPAPAPPPRTCGNARADPGEQCDPRDRRRPRGGCQEGYSCSRGCTCQRDQEGQRCGNNRKEGSEECDGTDSASCGADAHCTGSCQCEDNVGGGNQPVGPCRSEISRPIIGAISSRVNGDPDTVRTAAGAQGGQAVGVGYSTRVDPPGVIAAPSVTLSCPGCRGGSFTVDMSRVVVNVSQPCTVSGSFSLAGEQ